jgi:Predicted membrane protein (DUF2339)
LFFIGWFVVCLPALIYARVIENRRRRDSDAMEDKLKNLSRQLGLLEQRLGTTSAAAAAPPVYSVPGVQPVATQPPPAQGQQSFPAPAPRTADSPLAPPVVPVASPPPATPASIQRPAAEIAPAPSVRPPEPKPAPPPPPPPPVVAPKAGMPPASPSASATVLYPQPSAPAFSGSPPQRSAQAAAAAPARAAQPVVKKPKHSFEEAFWTKWAPIVGIAIVVIGIGFLVGSQWGRFPHVVRALIIYAGGFALLAGGVFLERKDRYKRLGRALIGGGWAVLALMTYAIANLEPLRLSHISRETDLFLLLAVIGAMVWHTLKYSSQVVTGAAFLLGFLAIGMNPSPPYNLIAGAMLIAGMTVIVLRYKWFELEVFGILASYANHFYWLYRVYEQQGERAIFPHHSASVALVLGYWIIFRASYLARKISGRQQEVVSTFAGLLNPILFLVVMKYQGFHPQWAWRVLLAMGALEFILGQLPVARRRRAPFQVLSSLGAALMVAAPAVRGSGNALEVIWLAGAEAFLLAGIFTRERLFRGFGLIISFLVALYALPVRVAPLVRDIFTGQPHHHVQSGLVLAAIALVLYANAHVTRRFWPALFADALEDFALAPLSFAASLFAVAAIYAYVPDPLIPVALALLVTALSGTGRLFSIAEMIYEAHWVAAAAFIQVVVSDRTLETKWLGVPQRVLAFGSVAALLYLSSWFVRLSGTQGRTAFSGAYAWAGTSLLTLLIWFQAPGWLVAVGWILLGLALSSLGQLLKRADLKWQAFALVFLSSGRALTVNMNLTASFPHVTYRLVSVSLIALGIYLVMRWAPLKQIRPLYSVAGTLLLAVLAFNEAPAPWTAVAWVSLALALALAARWWKDRVLLWQTHVLAVLAAGWTLYANFAPQYSETRVQLVTVGITAVVLYALTWLTNIAGVTEDDRICQAYAWAGSLLVSWLAWYQLQPIAVSVAWGIFALLLFEFPDLAKAMRIDVSRAASWRMQAYVALAGSFVHIFYSNFNVSGWGPPAYAVMALPPIYFYVYWQAGRREISRLEKVTHVDLLLATLGTATLAAIARFELPADAVVIGYAGLVVGALLVAWLAKRHIFLYQAVAMLVVAALRVVTNNFYHLHDPFGSSLSSAIWAIALLACAVPLAFQVRKNAPAGNTRGWLNVLALHPEQPMFFVPVALTAVLLFLKFSGGKVTGLWGLEGFVVFGLALWAKERSFRWTGLSLLMLSIGKLVYDTFQVNNPQVRYMTWIGLGILILVAAFLWARNREALRDYL